jgi:hypothetical protein
MEGSLKASRYVTIPMSFPSFGISNPGLPKTLSEKTVSACKRQLEYLLALYH